MGYDRNDCWMTCGEYEDKCAEIGLADGPFPKDPFAEIERLRAALEKIAALDMSITDDADYRMQAIAEDALGRS